MTELEELKNKLISIVGNYKEWLGLQFDQDHISRWLNQFPQAIHHTLLEELCFVLEKSYLNKEDIENYFKTAIIEPNLITPERTNTLKKISLLEIQDGGNSQKDCNKIFNDILEKRINHRSLINSPDSQIYLYLDDVVFSGQRVRTDLIKWVRNTAPSECQIYVFSHTMHQLSCWYNQKKIEEEILKSGKNVTLKILCERLVEDRLAFTDRSDVLRPVDRQRSLSVENYVKTLQKPPAYRNAGSVGGQKFFSNDQNRQLLEDAFLEAGSKIREICPNFSQFHRPLGYMSLDSLGFGTMIVSYRNCPNNAPLALWAGHPWYPLFPRSNNISVAQRLGF
ncbi:phosphoribosyltransferase-like protein [Pseudomonas sp. NMI760_13]|uniref:phosphoribosyltransferase-like protein n=1 Tax=Pseudomonas sp. NMI760_13 TaxID=2903147 RepID=UPI001E34CA1F|nr:hypothetical protein [Pseudomonas sp. NMI760_13]MCE0916650.1 hypothetical protein [Pseudomonas sp. NMI760_13]